ncbi:MAG: PAS domain S-box protein [candidate division Zixibacteria bacterium]|nr:PAS domain S-box protein [candidate division Zixibacteria bacterium]
MITTDNKNTMKQPVIETDEYLKQDNSPERENIECKQFGNIFEWQKIEWLTAFAFFAFCLFLWANEYFDIINFLLNKPLTPFNWPEALIETLIIAIIGNFVLTKLNRDIKARMQKEKEFLQKAENDWRDSFNSLEDIMIIIDKDYNIENINDSGLKILGKSRKEVIGKKCYNIVHNIESPADYCPFKKTLKTKAIEQTEQYEKVFGKYFSLKCSPVFDVNGNIVKCVELARDITKRKQAETEKGVLHTQLLQSEKMASIGQLAAGVAHEINNPVGYVYSNLNTMNKYLWKIQKYLSTLENQDSEAKEQFDEIITDFGDAISESLEGADRVKKIVADLKSFSHVDKDKSELADINKGLESTLNIVWNQLKYTCKVEKEFGNLPVLYCNINQLNQVFLNILVNAGQAITGSSGLIKIKTWADEKNIYISIMDNGAGIPQENLEKIFDPFFTTKEVGKGTGLGLSLSFEIIKKHNGKVDIKSEVGVGSEFIITLPITEAEHEHSKNPTT